MATRSYHHGDLRAALIEAGLALIEQRGADDLSLRETSRAVGVSAAAVYRHFPDKMALLRALAEVGFERLAEAQRTAARAAGGGIPGFNAACAAYVRFALASPGLFRLIFANRQPRHLVDTLTAEEPESMRLLQRAAAMLAPPGSDSALFALRAWSLVHGLAMLLLDGQVTLDDAEIDAAVNAHALVDPGPRH